MKMVNAANSVSDTVLSILQGSRGVGLSEDFLQLLPFVYRWLDARETASMGRLSGFLSGNEAREEAEAAAALIARHRTLFA